MSLPTPPKTGNSELDQYLQWVYIKLKSLPDNLIKDGDVLIGKTNGDFNLTTLTAGAGVTITNGDGVITISSP